MGKRIIALILSTSILLISGCASLIEGEYTSSEAHVSDTVSVSHTVEATAEVSNSEELRDAILSFVENYVSYGKINFTYDGDIEEELSAACISVANNTPIGAYSVYYINYKLNKIVSYYEADIAINYKYTAKELAAIATPEDSDEIKSSLLDIMKSHKASYAFYSPTTSFTADTLNNIVENLYYNNPEDITYLPKAEIYTYPEGAYPCIYEVVLSYPYSNELTKSRSESISLKLDTILASASELDFDVPVLAFATILNETARYDYEREALDDYSRWINIYTAYGALVMQKAAGEGFAMAMKLLCDRSGIECYVVRGRLNNVSHAWNIVRLSNGELYHFDCTIYEDPNNAFYNDAELSSTHWWDTSSYPSCNGESLLEADVAATLRPPVTQEETTNDSTQTTTQSENETTANEGEATVTDENTETTETTTDSTVTDTGEQQTNSDGED